MIAGKAQSELHVPEYMYCTCPGAPMRLGAHLPVLSVRSAVQTDIHEITRRGTSVWYPSENEALTKATWP